MCVCVCVCVCGRYVYARWVDMCYILYTMFANPDDSKGN